MLTQLPGYTGAVRGLVTVLMLTCGCNQLFGVERTDLVDSPPPADAAIDAPPPSCPTDGTVPQFKNDLFNIPARYCFYYSVSEVTGEAAALCANDNFTASTVGAGPIGESLVAQVLDPPMAINPYNAFVFTREGDRIAVTGWEETRAGYSTTEYRRSEAKWVFARTYVPASTMGGYYVLSAASAGPDRRAILFRYEISTNAYVLEELTESTGWKATDSYTLAELGTESLSEPSLSADGLRLVFVSYEYKDGSTTGVSGGEAPQMSGSNNAVYFTARTSLSERFARAKKMATVPDGVGSPFMTEDCGRIYFSALNSVWFLKQ